MSWYCARCSKRMGFVDSLPDIKDDEMIGDICEGCGKGWFDSKGRKLMDEHGNPPTYPPTGRLVIFLETGKEFSIVTDWNEDMYYPGPGFMWWYFEEGDFERTPILCCIASEEMPIKETKT